MCSGRAGSSRPGHFKERFIAAAIYRASLTAKTSGDIHLKSVNKAINELDVLVFTLGLTEAWENIECKSILPVVPGILGGVFDKKKYNFLNFDYS